MSKRDPTADAKAALKQYLEQTDDLEEAITDLMTDIQHLCAAELLDYDHLLKQAQRHYMVESLKG